MRGYVYLGTQLVAIQDYSHNRVAYPITDALGSLIAQANEAAWVDHFNYYHIWGDLQSGALSDGPGYAGQVHDTNTGLSYAQQRYYDPSLARFVSVDPVGVDPDTGGNFNRYWYANDNPYRYTDPDGRCPWCIGAVIGAVVDVAAQQVANGWGSKVDVKSVLVSAGVGAMTGGVASVARAAALRGAMTATQAVAKTAGANAVISAAGSAVDSAAHGNEPSAAKMVTAAAIGGGLSYGAGRIGNAEAIATQKMASSAVNTPEGIGAHIAAATQSAGQTAVTQSAAAVVGTNAANVGGAVVEKNIDQRIDKLEKRQ